MDIFEDGHLTRSYKITIGYPEFPLPSGMRSATNIIFNPSWTPPNEEWVRNSQKVEVGKKIAAGDKLNPLGPIKIPIGLPSLIHGGKSPAKLGGFGSHGCVGLTDDQVRDFAIRLADISSTNVSDIDIKKFGMKPTQTKTVKLNTPVPVELRYETIVVEDGKLHIYRDVYGQGTNTKDNLSKVLEEYGVSLNQLSRVEMAKVNAALPQMSRGITKAQNGQVTRAIKGKKEIAIPVKALAGKGYPVPATGPAQ
jgi:hypothetical protein